MGGRTGGQEVGGGGQVRWEGRMCGWEDGLKGEDIWRNLQDEGYEDVDGCITEDQWVGAWGGREDGWVRGRVGEVGGISGGTYRTRETRMWMGALLKMNG